MLKPGYVQHTSDNSDVKLAHVIDHMDHICQLAGNTDHIALGTDLDGGFGSEETPRDVDSIADVMKIPAILRRRGYAEEDVNAIMYGNWVRLLRESWS